MQYIRFYDNLSGFPGPHEARAPQLKVATHKGVAGRET